VQAAHESLRQSLDVGRNIRESLMSLEESLGQEVYLESLGLGSRNKETRLTLEKQLLEDRAQLETICEYYGDHHPKVIERRAKIAKVEEYLAQFDAIGSLRQEGRDETQLARAVLDLLGQPGSTSSTTTSSGCASCAARSSTRSPASTSARSRVGSR
jgi:hypothetical protein